LISIIQREVTTVLIPFSSGRDSHDILLQHQRVEIRLNPFFFRSRFPPHSGEGSRRPSVLIPFSSGRDSHRRLPKSRVSGKCLNPFFFRSRFPQGTVEKKVYDCLRVLIPFSSGRDSHKAALQQVAIREMCLNPFFFRSRFPPGTVSKSVAVLSS